MYLFRYYVLNAYESELGNHGSNVVLRLPELLLQTSQKLVVLPLREEEILVRELSVLLFQFAFRFIPIAFECEFVHMGTRLPRSDERVLILAFFDAIFASLAESELVLRLCAMLRTKFRVNVAKPVRAARTGERESRNRVLLLLIPSARTKTHHIDPIVLRKRVRATPNKTALIKPSARNCGHTTSNAPPRKIMPCASLTKCVVGAAIIIC